MPPPEPPPPEPSAPDPEPALACGCTVRTSRDFLGRVVGTIVQRGDGCSREGHLPGRVVLMPGRENARPE